VKTLACLVSALLFGCASQSTPPNPMPHVDRATNGPFVVALLLTDDFDRTAQEWQVPHPPSLSSISSAKLGSRVFTAFFVAGCQADDQGNCNVTFDLRLLDQNQVVANEVLQAPLCGEHPAPPPGELTFCPRSLVFTHTGKPTRFRVLSNAHDRNAGRTVHLEVSISFE